MISEKICVIERELAVPDLVLYEMSEIIVYGQGDSNMTLNLTEEDEAFIFFPWPLPESSECSGSQCTVTFAENTTLFANRMVAAYIYGPANDLIETSGEARITN